MFWLKTQNKILPRSGAKQLVISFLMLVLLSNTALVSSQKESVNFISFDSLTITADLYFSNDTLPYLILLHEQGSSRGEFESLAERFQKMDYNCLAADLRNGGNTNFVSNETARRSRDEDYKRGREEVENDIRASVLYAAEKSGKEVILLGSGATGALCLKIGTEMPEVHAVIALSPGEFFYPSLIIEDTITGLNKPVLVTSTQTEFPYIEKMLSGVSEEHKTIFKPEHSDGLRGSAALFSDNPSSGEYWLALLLFFKDLK